MGLGCDFFRSLIQLGTELQARAEDAAKTWSRRVGRGPTPWEFAEMDGKGKTDRCGGTFGEGSAGIPGK